MKPEKLHVGLIGLDLWLGGATYVHNIIRALLRLPAAERPRITLFCRTQTSLYDEVFHLADKVVRYTTKPASVLGNRALTRSGEVVRGFLWGQLFNDFTPELTQAARREQVDCMFPVCEYPSAVPHPIVWIPDVQHRYLPENFPWFTRVIRDRKFAAQLANKKGHVVFSSRAALESVIQVYGQPRAQTHILRFVTVPDASWFSDPAPVLARYQAPENFFIMCDQFWIHKDHPTVFRAVAKLAREGRKVHVVCTGPVTDHHHPVYIRNLRADLQKLGIESQVQILGALPRSDQFALIRSCQAVIKPSKYEGWSSILEEAKAFGKPAIVSDHPVHLEQAVPDFLYFRMGDVTDCARAIAEFLDEKRSREFDSQAHERRMDDFARTFMNIAYAACGGESSSVSYQAREPIPLVTRAG